MCLRVKVTLNGRPEPRINFLLLKTIQLRSPKVLCEDLSVIFEENIESFQLKLCQTSEIYAYFWQTMLFWRGCFLSAMHTP